METLQLELKYLKILRQIEVTISKHHQVSKWYKVWILNRHVGNSRIGIPSFSAANSMLAINSKPITRLAFTPIIPHPVTEYDAIFAAMVNFQNVDVLQQRGMSCGLFCSDEETYRLAKEFQLNHPERFDNIFLWIGGFHMEKIIIACCGKYLVESGINRVLVADKIFGLQVVKSVMEGSHYLGGKWGMEIIAVFMEHLQLSTFFNATDTNKYRDLFLQLTQLQSLFHANDTNLHLIGVA